MSLLKDLKYKFYHQSIRVNKNKAFITAFIKNGFKSFIYSVFILILIIVLDYLYKITLSSIMLNVRSDWFWFFFKIKTCSIVSVEGSYLEIFSNLISIGASVIGVILGLVYTAFVTIVSTKYTKINSTINSMIINQPVINKYFYFLATLTSLSILYQTIISLGYIATVFSVFIFAVLIVFAVTSFITFGKLTQSLIDTRYLVNDKLNDIHESINKLIKFIDIVDSNDNNEKNFISKVYNNLLSIELIIKEGVSASDKNSSFDGIYDDINSFHLYYLRNKHTIPSGKDWHMVVHKHKKVDEIQGFEASLFNQTGYLGTKEITGYNEIEKKIIEMKFHIFHYYLEEINKLYIINKELQYFAESSYQCNPELLDFYFNKLTELVVEGIKKNKDNIKLRYFLAQQISLFYINHIVGFFKSSEFITNHNLSTLANAITKQERTEKIIQYPYYLKIWLDQYLIKLNNEHFIDSKIVTPNSFTEYNLFSQICTVRFNYLKKLIDYSEKQIFKTLTKLKENGFIVESLIIALEYKEMIVKLDLMVKTELQFQMQITSYIYPDDVPPIAKNTVEINDKINDFHRKALNHLWELGASLYRKSDAKFELPDFIGVHYLILTNDIFRILIDRNFDKNERINKLLMYIKINFGYLYTVWESVREEETRVFALRLQPIVIDLLDILSTAVVVSKCNKDNALLDSIIKHFSEFNKSSLIELWRLPIAINNFSDLGVGLLSNRSYSNEHERESSLSEYLLKNNFIIKNTVRSSGKSFIDEYKSKINSKPINVLAKFFHQDKIDFMKIREIFIEIYLRKQKHLSELNIEETSYGKRFKK